MTRRTSPKPLIVGNWKMNGLGKDIGPIKRLGQKLAARRGRLKADILLCPPATLIAPMLAATQKTPIKIGGQDCHIHAKGAHTGDISAPMLKDAGAVAVLVGHSERRAAHGETDKQICAKAQAAHKAGLRAIICIGETLKARKSGKAASVISHQLRYSLPNRLTVQNTVIAYEPIWAIGTGLTPTWEQIAHIHTHIRKNLLRRYGAKAKAIPILYGGSVNPANAADILAIDNVNGVLVGGASLKAANFGKIIDSAL